MNTGFLGIAVWTGLTVSTGRYIVAVGYSSNSAFDNENGHFLGLFYSSDVHYKGPLYVKKPVSCAIKHLSVYHAYLYAIHLTK